LGTQFESYSEFAEATSSEKLVLAHVQAFTQLFNFTLDSGNLYKRQTDHVVVNVKRQGARLTKVSSSGEVDDETKFYFDVKNSELYLYSLSGDLAGDEIIAEIRLFFANHPVNTSWDLGNDIGSHVHYEGRIRQTPGFKSEVGTDQQGISVTGKGNLVLENTDGFFDDLYDTLIFEQKLVEIYSFNRDLLPSEAKILYRGFIVDKSFQKDRISFSVHDTLFKLDEAVPLDIYTESDGVGPQFVGDFKRRLYGKLDGVLLRSIDQVGNGFTLTGTVSNATLGNTTLVGTGTLFLDEVSPNDVLTIDGVEYDVETVDSDTSLTVSNSDGIETVFADINATNIPDRPWRKKNRTFLIASHAIRQVNTTVTQPLQLNRFRVDNPDEIEPGDILQVGAEAAEVRRVSNDLITLQQNMLGVKPIGTSVTKEPVQKVVVEGKQIVLSDIDTIDNNVSGATITLSDLTEFNISRNIALPSYVDLQFTNGSREITTTADVDLTLFAEPRDWIKAGTQADIEFLEILQVEEQKITVRTPFTAVNTLEPGDVRRPLLIDDETNVSANVLGKTKDGTAAGDWIQTGAEVIKDLLDESALGDFVDTEGFDLASLDAPQLMAIKIPFDIRSKSTTTIRSVVNDINTSIFGSLVLNNSLELRYNILDVSLFEQDLPIIREDDIIDYTIKSKSGKLYKTAQTQYNFKDFDNAALDSAASALTHTNDFVEAFETSVKTFDLNLQVFKTNDAQELAERFTYFNSLSQAEIRIDARLNMSDLQMGDKVILDLRRLYRRLGDFSTRLKVGTVVGIRHTGKKIELKISDLGNLFNRSGKITDDLAPEYTLATSDDKLTGAYITDENGIINNEEQTSQTNLIT